MRLIMIFSAVLLFITTPAKSELSQADIERIRTVLKEDIRVIVNEEITASEKRMKEYVSQEIKTVNVKIGEMDKRLNQTFWLVIALIGFIAVVIGIPQIFVAARGKEQQAQAEKIEELQREMQLGKRTVRA
ncbi:hypothetical protein F4054_00030 [Candidatus Poribacteria bacterium]|nr:hypothetical protein [Candidatus Poribacteria bacterium]MYK20633.1 hypothetical protein [Candidatus Poribacteria bacterium]